MPLFQGRPSTHTFGALPKMDQDISIAVKVSITLSAIEVGSPPLTARGRITPRVQTGALELFGRLSLLGRAGPTHTACFSCEFASIMPDAFS